MSPIDLCAEALPADVHLAETDGRYSPNSLIEPKPFARGTEANPNAQIADDQQLMSLLVDPRAAEAVEYGDPLSKKEALQTMAVKAMRELGLPACLGNYIDLQNDKVIRSAIKSELSRRDVLDQSASYATQDLNGWDTSMDRIETLVRTRLTPDETDKLNYELEMWAKEMTHKSQRISNGLAKLRH